MREFVEFAFHLADLADAQILPRFRAPVGMENKSKGGGFDPVTVADREAEAAIRREIRRVYPDHGILGEEHGFDAGSSAYTWILDPIDGTRSFVLGQLHWGTLIALNDGNAPVVGLMRQPYTGETFIGTAAGSELRRGTSTTRLTARAASRLADVTLCATDPTMFAGEAHQRAFARLAPHARAVRFGGDCYTPCLVAGGLGRSGGGSGTEAVGRAGADSNRAGRRRRHHRLVRRPGRSRQRGHHRREPLTALGGRGCTRVVGAGRKKRVKLSSAALRNVAALSFPSISLPAPVRAGRRRR